MKKVTELICDCASALRDFFRPDATRWGEQDIDDDDDLWVESSTFRGEYFTFADEEYCSNCPYDTND